MPASWASLEISGAASRSKTSALRLVAATFSLPAPNRYTSRTVNQAAAGANCSTGENMEAKASITPTESASATMPRTQEVSPHSRNGDRLAVARLGRRFDRCRSTPLSICDGARAPSEPENTRGSQLRRICCTWLLLGCCGISFLQDNIVRRYAFCCRVVIESARKIALGGVEF